MTQTSPLAARLSTQFGVRLIACTALGLIMTLVVATTVNLKATTASVVYKTETGQAFVPNPNQPKPEHVQMFRPPMVVTGDVQ